jgi:hypothetical protein
MRAPLSFTRPAICSVLKASPCRPVRAVDVGEGARAATACRRPLRWGPTALRTPSRLRRRRRRRRPRPWPPPHVSRTARLSTRARYKPSRKCSQHPMHALSRRRVRLHAVVLGNAQAAEPLQRGPRYCAPARRRRPHGHGRPRPGRHARARVRPPAQPAAAGHVCGCAAPRHPLATGPALPAWRPLPATAHALDVMMMCCYKPRLVGPYGPEGSRTTAQVLYSTPF